MSNATREINRITSAIIRISVKLILLALIILLLYEAVTRGYAFGHQIFYAEAVDQPPGQDRTILIEEGTDVADAASLLAKQGLIKSEFAFIFQSLFYDSTEIQPGEYTLNTSMTSKEILQELTEESQESTAQETAAAASARTRSETEEASAEQEESQTAQEESAQEESVQTEAETEETYPGEDIEDGDWIQDITEGAVP